MGESTVVGVTLQYTPLNDMFRWVAFAVMVLLLVRVDGQEPTDADCQSFGLQYPCGCTSSGVVEQVQLNLDCDQEDLGDGRVKVTFPMKEHTVNFPCIFERKPVVIPQPQGNADKICGLSIKDITKGSFIVNVQRVDDTEDSDMTCSKNTLSYIAIQ